MTGAIDFEKSSRETLRWLILSTLNAARPLGAAEMLILSAISGIPFRVTALDLRRELDYLEERKLVEIDPASKDTPAWHSKLTRYGVDVVEYTVPCDPGIARPKKYW